MLKELLRGSDESALLAYQIAFDLVESEHQHFVLEVNKHLPQKQASGSEEKKSDDEVKEGGAGESSEAGASGMDVDGEAGEGSEGQEFVERMKKLRQVLVDGLGIDLFLNFLYKMNKTDLLMMKSIKTSLEARNSVLHNATVVAHGYMQAGTTVRLRAVMHAALMSCVGGLGVENNQDCSAAQSGP